MMRHPIPFSFALLLCIVIGLSLYVSYPTFAEPNEPSEPQIRATDPDTLLNETLQDVGASPKPTQSTPEQTSDDGESFFDRFRLPFSNKDESSQPANKERDPSIQEVDGKPIARRLPERPVIETEKPTSQLIQESVAPPTSPEISMTEALPQPTLDELLQRAKRSTISQEEILLSRLNKREVLVEALKRTLDVTAGVAEHGEAAIQLLSNEDLETVISTLTEQHQHREVSIADARSVPTVIEPVLTPTSSVEKDQDPSF